MNTAITALTTPAAASKGNTNAANAEANDRADTAGFGAVLKQTVNAQRGGNESKTPANTSDKSQASAGDKSAAKTDDGSEAKADDTAAQADPSAALVQALAALGLTPGSNAVSSTPATRATPADATADAATGVDAASVAGKAARATNAATDLGAGTKAGGKAAAGADALATDKTQAAAGSGLQARADTHADALGARVAQALRATTESDTKRIGTGDTANAPRFTDVLNGLASSAALAATSTANTAAANTQTAAQQTIASPFGSAAWANEVTEQVRSFALQKIEVAELKLNPQELGPIRVEIALDKGNAAIHFSAARDDVRDALAQNIGNLRDALANAGVSLQNASTGNFGEGQAFAFMQRQSQGDGTRATAGGDGGSDGAAVATSPVAASRTRSASADGVDLFA